MSPLIHLLFFLVLAALGGFICRISVPMLRERAGHGYRLVAVAICLAGTALLGAALMFLAGAIAGIPA